MSVVRFLAQPYGEGALAVLPCGATRAAGWTSRVLCDACQGINLGNPVFNELCKVPVYQGEPVPRAPGPPTVIIEKKNNERINEVLATAAGTAGQQRKTSAQWATILMVWSWCVQTASEAGRQLPVSTPLSGFVA